jgi:hypothetical protein
MLVSNWFDSHYWRRNEWPKEVCIMTRKEGREKYIMTISSMISTCPFTKLLLLYWFIAIWIAENEAFSTVVSDCSDSLYWQPRNNRGEMNVVWNEMTVADFDTRQSIRWTDAESTLSEFRTQSSYIKLKQEITGTVAWSFILRDLNFFTCSSWSKLRCVLLANVAFTNHALASPTPPQLMNWVARQRR